MKDEFKIIKTEDEIKTRIKELAGLIDKEFNGEEVVVVGILKGSFIFLSDLIRQMKSEVSCEFLATRELAKDIPDSGEVKIILDLNSPIRGKNVLLIEDIVSDALTLEFISNTLKARKPKKLKTCCFVRRNKGLGDASDFDIDFVGFDIKEEKPVIGYGIDYEGRFRNRPYLASLK